jgi:hypothetical protein
MKFLSRSAPVLGARIIHNPREKPASFLEPPRKILRGLQLRRCVVGLGHDLAKINHPFHA